MNYRKVTAIIRQNTLEKVERKLQEMGVKDISVIKVKGYVNMQISIPGI